MWAKGSDSIKKNKSSKEKEAKPTEATPEKQETPAELTVEQPENKELAKVEPAVETPQNTPSPEVKPVEIEAKELKLEEPKPEEKKEEPAILYSFKQFVGTKKLEDVKGTRNALNIYFTELRGDISHPQALAESFKSSNKAYTEDRRLIEKSLERLEKMFAENSEKLKQIKQLALVEKVIVQNKEYEKWFNDLLKEGKDRGLLKQSDDVTEKLITQIESHIDDAIAYFKKLNSEHIASIESLVNARKEERENSLAKKIEFLGQMDPSSFTNDEYKPTNMAAIIDISTALRSCIKKGHYNKDIANPFIKNIKAKGARLDVQELKLLMEALKGAKTEQNNALKDEAKKHISEVEDMNSTEALIREIFRERKLPIDELRNLTEDTKFIDHVATGLKQ